MPAVGVPAPELGERDRVERARGDPAADPEPAEPGAQLARGLAGERDREDVVRVDVARRAPATRSGG